MVAAVPSALSCSPGVPAFNGMSVWIASAGPRWLAVWTAARYAAGRDGLALA